MQVSIAVFRALSKNVSDKDGSAPLDKIGPYAYGHPRSIEYTSLPGRASAAILAPSFVKLCIIIVRRQIQ